jgi:hypothetical protein
MHIPTLRANTQAHLEAYVGLDASMAAALVDAVRDAAQAEVLGMVSGGEPYPSSMGNLL